MPDTIADMDADGVADRLQPPPSIAHVLMPLGVSENSLAIVARGLSDAHTRAGGLSYIVASDNREVDVGSANPIRVRHRDVVPRGWFTRREQLRDILRGTAGLSRTNQVRLHAQGFAQIASAQPDHLLVYEGHYATCSLRAYREAGLRPHLYVHTPVSRTIRRTELTRNFASAESIIFVSERLANTTLARCGTDVRHTCIGNGVDDWWLEPVDRPPTLHWPLRVLYVGQTVPDKGVHVLIAALRLAESRGRVLEARVVGSPMHGVTGPLTDYELELRKDASKLQAAVGFEPFSPRAAIRSHFEWADVVVVPSVWAEPFGMVALEAMASGVPVIASNRGGLPEATGGEATLTSPTPTAIADAIVGLTDERAREQSQRGRAWALTRSWSAVNESLLLWLGRR